MSDRNSHCGNTSKPTTYIDCQGDVWGLEGNQTGMQPVSEMVRHVIQTLCNDIPPAVRTDVLYDVCHIIAQYDRLIIPSSVSVKLNQNTITLPQIQCGKKQLSANHTCYTFNATNVNKRPISIGVVAEKLHIHGVCLSEEMDNMQTVICDLVVPITAEIPSHRVAPSTVEETCGHNQFRCTDNHCIMYKQTADGVTDCPDGSDEINIKLNCSYSIVEWDRNLHESPDLGCVCGHDYYQCKTEECLHWYKVCDEVQDCYDSSDELNCMVAKIPKTIKHQKDFQCGDKNNNTVLSDFVNDLIPDCPNAADENEKHTHLTEYDNTCQKRNHIPCEPGIRHCFPIHAICLYDRNELGHLKYCRNGAHLSKCTNMDCPSTFKCPGSYCISATRLCDHVEDCPNGEDEVGCNHTSPVLCPGMFYCRGGSCAHQAEVCDGERDCPLGDDEAFCHWPQCPTECHCMGPFMKCNMSTAMPVLHLTDYFVLVLMGGIENIDGVKKTESLILFNVTRNRVSYLTPSGFSDYVSLQVLDLSYNQISTLETNVFAGLAMLHTLLLTGNTINQIDPYAFTGLITMTRLNLSALEISRLHPSAFDGMSNLAHLDISHNLLNDMNLTWLLNISDISLNMILNPMETFVVPINAVTANVSIDTDQPFVCCLLQDCEGTDKVIAICPQPMSTHWKAIIGLFGFVTIFLNLFSASSTYRRAGYKKRLTIVNTLFVFLLDGIMGFTILIVSLNEAIFPSFIVESIGGKKHIACLLIAWIQVVVVGTVCGIRTKQAWNFYQLTTSMFKLQKTVPALRLFGWITAILLCFMLANAPAIVVPLMVTNSLPDISPMCSLMLLPAHSYYTRYITVCLLALNVILNVVTFGCLIKGWKAIMETNKQVSIIGNQSQLSYRVLPGKRMLSHSIISFLTHVFGIIVLLTTYVVLDSTMTIQVSVVVAYGLPSAVNPLLYHRVSQCK